MDNTLDWWPSPAKLNLFLHITGRYDNGYHQLQSLFQLLDYGDQLAFELRHDDSVRMATTLAGVADDENLIIRAARLLQQHCQLKQGCDIHLHKVLPMGGGIGGGSSNAATTLVVLNHLWQCHLPLTELARLGLSLGADVPIFVHGQTAFAEGVGEQVYPANIESKCYLVAYPNCHISTASVFAAKDLPRSTAKIRWQDYSFDTTHNDCEKLVCQQHEEVANLLQWLIEYAPSRMSGTGACVFAIFDNAEAAKEVLKTLPPNYHGFIANGVNRSPLHNKLMLKCGSQDRD